MTNTAVTEMSWQTTADDIWLTSRFKKLGLTIPQSVLARADRIIE